jgi:metal-responsive CopG/Arc/MetJ family transcriptional regulator
VRDDEDLSELLDTILDEKVFKTRSELIAKIAEISE